jgi:hypothetical protein
MEVPKHSQQFFSIEIPKLHPTQFTVGMHQIRYKINQIEEKYRNGNLHDYFMQKTSPTIIGPGNQYYIVDRHHTALALWMAKIPLELKKLLICLKEDMSHLSHNEFEKYMIENKHCYLNNGKNKFSELPLDVNGLKDDPYRSFSWIIRKLGGYEKSSVSYSEFYWANFFRKHKLYTTDPDSPMGKIIIKEAMELCRSEKAKLLPGYIPAPK